MSKAIQKQAKKQSVKTDLYASKAPLEWAVVSNNTLYTAQIPIDDKGDVVKGGIEAQTRQTFANLKHTLACANEDMDAVVQVLIYVTKREYLATVNKIYSDYFTEPYPNRAALVVAGLAREEMLVEFVVYANVSNSND